MAKEITEFPSSELVTQNRKVLGVVKGVTQYRVSKMKGDRSIGMKSKGEQEGGEAEGERLPFTTPLRVSIQALPICFLKGQALAISHRKVCCFSLFLMGLLLMTGKKKKMRIL